MCSGAELHKVVRHATAGCALFNESPLASKKGASAAVAAPAAVVTAAGTDGEQPVDNYNPLLQGCRSIEHYERIKYINEGAYGMVFAARNRVTGEVVAIKQVKMSRETQKEGFPITALRETNVLLSLHHPNIVRVHEMVTGSSLDKIYMVMEYFEADLKSVLTAQKARGEALGTAEVKCLLLQLIRAVAYLHKHWFIHRDLKTSNLLYSSKGA
eukprot:3384-Heterococcus_DN1.PRE.1